MAPPAIEDLDLPTREIRPCKVSLYSGNDRPRTKRFDMFSSCLGGAFENVEFLLREACK